MIVNTLGRQTLKGGPPNLIIINAALSRLEGIDLIELIVAIREKAALAGSTTKIDLRAVFVVSERTNTYIHGHDDDCWLKQRKYPYS
jgi:hypothetical protein